MKKKGYKRVLGLKKWNKIVSALVKNYKKTKTPYDFAEVRKEASQIYLGFKSVPLAKLSQKRVISSKSKVKKVSKPLKAKTIRILATDIPKSEIEKVGGWRFFELENISDFNNKFPEVPILIKSPNNEFKINGKIGGYGGSELSKFVNDTLRIEYEDNYQIVWESSVALQEENKLPYLLLLADDMNKKENKKELDRLLKSKVGFPKRVDKEVKKEVEKRVKTEEEKQKEREAEKKRKKQKLKKTKPKPKAKTKAELDKEKKKRAKVKVKKEKTPSDKIRLAELRIEEQKNIMEMFKLGLLDKKEANQMIKELKDKYKAGGKV